jgi:CspA family cold shock protein
MDTGNVAVGFLKRFDRDAGYGFLVSDSLVGDIFIHVEQLQTFGISGISETARITFEYRKSERGYAVSRIVSIESGRAGLPETASVAGPSELEPARVKWFDEGKGFGFARVFGNPDDVYISKAVINNSSFTRLNPGDALCVRVTKAQRGLSATAIYPWEMAAKSGQGDY